MKLLDLLYNPTAEHPTAGVRGILALAFGLSAPIWIDWRDPLLLLIVVVGGLVTGLQLLSQANREID